jgi:hypothetical protein
MDSWLKESELALSIPVFNVVSGTPDDFEAGRSACVCDKRPATGGTRNNGYQSEFPEAKALCGFTV